MSHSLTLNVSAEEIVSNVLNLKESTNCSLLKCVLLLGKNMMYFQGMDRVRGNSNFVHCGDVIA